MWLKRSHLFVEKGKKNTLYKNNLLLLLQLYAEPTFLNGAAPWLPPRHLLWCGDLTDLLVFWHATIVLTCSNSSSLMLLKVS